MAKLLILFLIITTTMLATAARAKVPPNKTFKFVIYQSDIDESERAEYGANYLEVRMNDALNFSTPPFQLCFFTTTPNAFVLGLRAGDIYDRGTMRWVWDANRNHPVRDGAALTFTADGNLAIVDADNRSTVAWQTNTANKGVTGIKLLPDGNLVLHDAAGKFVWQSFDHPTDTLLLGQSLKVKGLNKLVSRKSDADGSDGPYSLVVENRGLLTKVKKGGRVLTYGGWNGEDFGDLTFTVSPEAEPAKAYELVFKILSASNVSDRPLEISVGELTYIPRVSFIRIGSDGSFNGYSYADQVANDKWRQTFSFFKKEFGTECDLPAKCGDFGLCREGMCVACPTPDVMLGWNESCKPSTPPPCNKKTAVKYYKMDGVGHFLSRSGNSNEAGKMKIGECKARCDGDCKCLGYFYTDYESKCLLAPVMGTLATDQYTVAYIKYSNS